MVDKDTLKRIQKNNKKIDREIAIDHIVDCIIEICDDNIEIEVFDRDDVIGYVGNDAKKEIKKYLLEVL